MQPAGKHFAKVTAKAYARHGVAWAGLLSNWPTIAGAELDAISQPEKITWPGANSQGKLATSKYQKIGGVLTIRVGYGRALEIQHLVPQIMDRINAYFGYSAITQIKITQGKVEKPQPERKFSPQPLDQENRLNLNNKMAGIESEELKSALTHLATGVLSGEKSINRASKSSKILLKTPTSSR